jgi:NTE family protein
MARYRRVVRGQGAMNEAPIRSLILAGGGMRVAWQAGVLLALEEVGLTFAHVDGASGGIMNTAATLSGVTPASLCERWSTLEVPRFASPLPVRRYLRTPNLPAFGDAEGVLRHVFPHLGIDIAKIRACDTPVATFNVCNFDDKVSVAIPNHEVTLDHLVAGMSLPIVMPAVRHDGVTWTDAVWIRDANLLEAVRRGAEEIWVLWCIANTPRYGEGPLEQYVHMIEMSAVGSLNEELLSIAEHNRTADWPIRVHVIKPQHPLPLDPEFFLGRIDARTLVAMGYRDAWRYLDDHLPEGVALDVAATKMVEPGLGVRYRDRMTGSLMADDAGVRAIAGAVTLRVGVEMHDVERLARGDCDSAPVVGSIRFDDRAVTRYFRSGSVDVCRGGGRSLRYTATFDLDGTAFDVEAVRRFPPDRPALPRVWAGLSEVEVGVGRLDAGGGPRAIGTLRASGKDVLRILTSVEPSAAHGLRDRLRAVTALGKVVASRS